MRTFQRALRTVSFLLLAVFFINTAHAQDIQDGQKTFTNICSACHKLGEVLIGPDLTGVKTRWKDESKLIAFVRNSQSVINGGDPYAKALFDKFNHTIMPPQDLTDDQIKNVLAYESSGGKGPEVAGGGSSASGGGGAENFTPVPGSDTFVKWILILVVVLVVIVLLLANRLLGFLNRSKEHETEEHEFEKRGINWQKVNSFIWPLFGIGFFVFIWQQWEYGKQFLRPSQSASEVGEVLDKLFNTTVVITGIVFILTHILLFWYGFRYRRNKSRKGYYYPHNNMVEFIWTSVPAVVLAILVLYGFKTWNAATSKPTGDHIEIEAFAKQFDWTFRYPGPDGKLGRTNFMLIDPVKNPLGIDFTDPASKDDAVTTEFHLPVNKTVMVHLRSQDVTHDFYLVHFRVQMYANPGLENWLKFKPIYTTDDYRKLINNPNFDYELACNQLCGAGHFNMRRVLVIDKQADFDKWARGLTPSYTKYTQATASK
jgi:cytochrome c oxidase subunit 2